MCVSVLPNVPNNKTEKTNFKWQDVCGCGCLTITTITGGMLDWWTALTARRSPVWYRSDQVSQWVEFVCSGFSPKLKNTLVYIDWNFIIWEYFSASCLSKFNSIQSVPIIYPLLSPQSVVFWSNNTHTVGLRVINSLHKLICVDNAGAGRDKQRWRVVSLNLCRNRMSSIVYKAPDRLISRAAAMPHVGRTQYQLLSDI